MGFEIAEIVEFITGALVSVNVPPEDASQVAALMAESDTRGGDAHGIFPTLAVEGSCSNTAVSIQPGNGR
jgi:LDH2 family malate/lactate/ureidoglycolate dehydrogenase